MKGGIETLRNQIYELYQELKMAMRKEWDRDLPLEELLFDRWARAKELGFGKNTSIYHNSYVFGDVKVGDNTWIGPFTILDGSGGLAIGNFCSISAGVQIYSHNSVKWALSGGKQNYEKRPVQIGNSCFIGPHTVISSGISIGNHTVIGANSFVNKDIPAFSIAFGSPVKVVGSVKFNEAGQVNLEYFGDE